MRLWTTESISWNFPSHIDNAGMIMISSYSYENLMEDHWKIPSVMPNINKALKTNKQHKL